MHGQRNYVGLEVNSYDGSYCTRACEIIIKPNFMYEYALLSDLKLIRVACANGKMRSVCVET